MPLALTAGVRAMVRHAIEVYSLDHLYDLTKASVVSGEDATGYVTRTPGATTTGLACHFRDVSAMQPDAGGLVVMEKPLLVVQGDGAAAEGDSVANVRTKDGTVLMAGPVLIENVLDAQPGVGGPMSKVLALRTEEELPR